MLGEEGFQANGIGGVLFEAFGLYRLQGKTILVKSVLTKSQIC